jgi:putative ABC transport system permease protein
VSGNSATHGWMLPLRLSVAELSSHRMRTAITGLAVLFGVAALLVMSSMARGMEDSNRQLYLQMGGAQILIATPKEAADQSEQARFSRSGGLRLSDVAILMQALPEFDAWVPELSMGRGEIRSTTGRLRAMGTASTWDRFDVLGIEFDTVDNLTQHGWESGEAMAVIGPEVATQLKREVVVGSSVIVGGVPVRVAGIFKTSGKFDRRSYEAMVPLNWYKKVQSKGDPQLAQLRARVANLDDIPAARENLRREIVAIHRGNEDVDLSTNDDLLEDSRKTIATMSMVTILISVVALLSGGVGILNIQLAALSARVRELGVCKALGAPSGLLFKQMLLESMLISAIGGMLGCALGILPGIVMGSMFPWKPHLTMTDLAMGVGISLGLGTLAGLLPAIKAMRLDAIDAMRA